MMKIALQLIFAILLPFISWNQTTKDTCLQRIEKITSIKSRIHEFDFAAIRCWQSGEYESAVDYANRGLSLCEEISYPKFKAVLLNDRGVAYDFLGKYSLSLKSLFAALRIQETLPNRDYEAYILSNIGLVYDKQGLLKKSFEYHQKSLKIRSEINNPSGIAASNNNIGNIHLQWKQFDKAIDCYNECIEFDSKLNDTFALADDYNNLGTAYIGLKQYDTALELYHKSLSIRSKMDSPYLVAQSIANIGTVYYNMKQYEKARPFLLRSLTIADSISGKDLQISTLTLLYILEEKVGDSTQAYKYFKLYTEHKESSDKAEDIVKQTELEMEYEFDKQKEKDKLIQEKKDAQARIILYSVIGGLILILIFSLLLFKRWKYAQSQQKIIEEKNHLVEQKNEEIMDSITYAKRIQTAILPSAQLLNELIPNQFVLYLPKDIVAGDFYWLENLKDKIFFAVADCTGHGVPGAMMSVVCHNALNRAVREFGLTVPGLILDKTRDIIVSELSKNDHAVSDGMDISLCVLDQNENTISWAGANNPLWIYRSTTQQMEEWKANKQPIGVYGNYIPFTTQVIEVYKNDRIYLFTDGFADQFGGDKGKKLMKKAFQNLLLKTSTLSTEKQKIELEQFYWSWKGGLDQVDDVCVSCVVI